MFAIEEALDALERACEGDAELISYIAPDINHLIEAIKALPANEREVIQNRLERVSTIIEGKMMMYAEEVERLGSQIKHVAHTSAATNAYRAVAVFPVTPQGGA